MTSRNEGHIDHTSESSHGHNGASASDQRDLTLEHKVELLTRSTQFAQASYGILKSSEHIQNVLVNIGEPLSLRIEELQMQLGWLISATEEAEKNSNGTVSGAELRKQIVEIIGLLKTLDRLEPGPLDWKPERLHTFLEKAGGVAPTLVTHTEGATSNIIEEEPVMGAQEPAMNQRHRLELEHRKLELQCMGARLDREQQNVKHELRRLSLELSVIPRPRNRDDEVDEIDRMLLGHDLDESDDDDGPDAHQEGNELEVGGDIHDDGEDSGDDGASEHIT